MHTHTHTHMHAHMHICSHRYRRGNKVADEEDWSDLHELTQSLAGKNRRYAGVEEYLYNHMNLPELINELALQVSERANERKREREREREQSHHFAMVPPFPACSLPLFFHRRKKLAFQENVNRSLSMMGKKEKMADYSALALFSLAYRFVHLFRRRY